MVGYLQQALLPPLKLLLGKYRSTFGFLGFIHVYVLPFVVFLQPDVLARIELK